MLALHLFVTLCLLKTLVNTSSIFNAQFVSSYEELLMDSSDDENEEEEKKKRKVKGSRGLKQMEGGRAQSRGRAWIKESSRDDPVNFLDPGVVQNVVGMAKCFVLLFDTVLMSSK